MQANTEDIKNIVLLGTLFFFLITFFVIVFVIIHQRQSNKYIKEKENMKNMYQQEILKAQLEMKEQTLHTISQEIHDNLGQLFSLVKLNLNTIKLEENNPAFSKISDTKELVTRAIQDMRHLSKTLNPDFLSRQNLSDAIRFELEQIQKTGQYKTTLQIIGDERPFDAQRQLIILRITQENLNNIIKHSKASTISVVLSYSSDRLKMTIEDDGTGFQMSTIDTGGIKEKGTGIGNMYHRAKLIEAEFTIDSRLNIGTKSELSIQV